MNIPLPTAIKRPHAPTHFIVVSGFEAARVGTRGLMSVAVQAHLGDSTWETTFTQEFRVESSRLFPSLNEPEWPAIPVPEYHPAVQDARRVLTQKVDEAIAALSRVHGCLPTLLPYATIQDYRCRRALPLLPTMRVQALRSQAHALAQVDTHNLVTGCLEPGSLFATAKLEVWNSQCSVVQPLINAQLRPIVIATDASRSHRGAAIAAVSSTGEIVGQACARKNIHELELDAINFAVAHFSARYPSRKLIILSDSRHAVRRVSADINASWVRGHAGHSLNDIADRAARQHRNQQEAGFSAEWMAQMHEHLVAELVANLRQDPSVGSYFYEDPTQMDVSLVA